MDKIEQAHPATAYVPNVPLYGHAGRSGGLLNKPFMVKDLFDVAGWPTTASSTFYASLRPVPDTSAALVKRLLEAGAVCVGKTHLNEFAYGLSGENPHYGDCPHPVDPTCLSGGSSSGSAYAVAKGWVPFAAGTDTGGSIRVPAAFCGVWGVRYIPWFLVEGCLPLAPSFDTVGFLCDGPATLYELNAHLLAATGNAEEAKAPVRSLGVLRPEWCSSRESFDAYKQAYSERGIVIDKDLSWEMGVWIKQLPQAFNVLQSLEALEVHAHWLDRYKLEYDPVVWARIDRARRWDRGVIEDALLLRETFRNWIMKVLGDSCHLVMPAVPRTSPEKTQLSETFRQQLLRLTVPASMAGLPVITEPLPMEEDGRWTLGLQHLAPSLAYLKRLGASLSGR